MDNIKKIVKAYFDKNPSKREIWEKYSKFSLSGNNIQNLNPNYDYITSNSDNAITFDRMCNQSVKNLFKDLIFDNNLLFKEKDE